MSQLSASHIDYITGAFAVAIIYITAGPLLLVRYWRAVSRASHPHPDGRDQWYADNAVSASCSPRWYA